MCAISNHSKAKQMSRRGDIFFESPTYQIKPPFSFEKGSQMKISIISQVRRRKKKDPDDADDDAAQLAAFEATKV